MRTMLLALLVAFPGVSLAHAETWNAAYKRGDYATAATLLQRAVFEHPAAQVPSPAALRQLALMYGDGKGVERDPVLACGLARAHAGATAGGAQVATAAARSAAALVEKYCAHLPDSQRAAAVAAMSCPRIGLKRGAILALEPGWTIQFNDRSATITRDGEAREQPLADGLLCGSQVIRVRHTPLVPPGASSAGPRHLIEFITVRSAWHGDAISRELVWRLYEVRGLDLDLAAVERWRDPGSAFPAPPLPVALARGATFAVRGSEIAYEIANEPPRRGTLAGPRSPQ